MKVFEKKIWVVTFVGMILRESPDERPQWGLGHR